MSFHQHDGPEIFGWDNYFSIVDQILWSTSVVSTHRRILGLASVVCVLVKIRVSSISLYKLDTDKLTAPFESAHQFTLVCTVSDSKTVPGCHYNLCSNHSFVLTNSYLDLSLFRAVFSLPGLFLPLLYTDLCLLQPWSEMFFLFCERFESAAVTIGTLATRMLGNNQRSSRPQMGHVQQ